MSSNEVSHRVRFGPYEADLRTHELRKHGTRLKLAGQPFQILEVLLSRPDDLISRDELREKLWPQDTFVDFDHGLNAAVNKLRDALSDSADDPKYIETLPRRGYRFIGKVEPQEPAKVPAREAVQPGPVPSVEPQPLPPISAHSHLSPFRRWRAVIFGVVGLLLLILVVVGAIVIITPFVRRDAVSGAPPRTEPIVNVPDAVRDPALSPDGNRVAYVRNGTTPATAGIFVKEIGGDSTVQLTHAFGDCCPVWSPDGKYVAFSRRAGEGSSIYYLVPATGGEEHRLVQSGVPARGVDWSPDGKSLVLSGVSADQANGIFLVPLDDPHAKRITTPPAGAADWGATFSPDGRKLCFVRSERSRSADELMLMGLSDGVTRSLITESGGILGPPTWNADGNSVVYSTARGGTPALWRVPISKGKSTPIEDAGGNV